LSQEPTFWLGIVFAHGFFGKSPCLCHLRKSKIDESRLGKNPFSRPTKLTKQGQIQPHQGGKPPESLDGTSTAFMIVDYSHWDVLRAR
jgi:hypothetical protein